MPLILRLRRRLLIPDTPSAPFRTRSVWFMVWKREGQASQLSSICIEAEELDEASILLLRCPKRLLPRIVKPAHGDLALRCLADMLCRVLDLVGEQGEPRSALDGVDCQNRCQYIMKTFELARRLPGTTNPSNGASSGITAFGSANAPIESSCTSGVAGDTGREARTTLAKCVGTPTLGGLPMTS